MSDTQVQLGTVAIRTFETLSREHGSNIAPASLPTVLVAHVNGSVNSVLQAAITITQMQDATPANILGYYRMEFATTALAANDDIDIRISASISGATVIQVFRFVILNAPGLLPVIR